MRPGGGAASTASSAVRDQLDAAVRDQRQLHRNLARALQERLGEPPTVGWARAPQPILDWVKSYVRAELVGEAKRCRHVTPRAPMPIFAYMFRPNAVSCRQCHVQAAQEVAETEEDWTCDFCRRHTDGLYLFQWLCGPLAIHGGVCKRCGDRFNLALLKGEPST